MFFRLLEVWLMFVESLADVCVEVFVIVRIVFGVLDDRYTDEKRVRLCIHLFPFHHRLPFCSSFLQS